MSYFYIKPVIGPGRFADTDEALPFVGSRLQYDHSADRAIDSALRSVPLPEGLMTRLGTLVFTMADEAADQVDYLGC